MPPIYYYGFEADNNDFVVSDLLRSTTWFNLYSSLPWSRIGSIPYSNFGRHNIMNATAVIGLLYIAGFDLDLVREAFEDLCWRETSLH